jgi:cyclopropane fatty-acyl-phospholipid synthase-like methyltransferase
MARKAISCGTQALVSSVVTQDSVVAHDEVPDAARGLGAGELFGKASCAARARLPLLLCRRRTVRGVAAYFDLITDDGRLFFGDSFHLGFFPDGRGTLAQALDAHTDLVCELAGIRPGMRVLDVGCGIGEPARRIASRIDCEIVGLNISREQVRQGRELIARAGLAARVDIRHGNALQMPVPGGGFDAAICLEVAGDICVRTADKPRLLAELRRVLRPGGQVGFSDLAFDRPPTAAEDRALRALLYHSGRELLTDWPALFAAAGFQLGAVRDIQAQTLPTWPHVQAVYRQHAAEVEARYGRRLAPGIACRIDRQIAQVAAAIERCGSYPALSATAPSTPPAHHTGTNPVQ